MAYGARVLCHDAVGAGFALAGLEPLDAASPERGRERLEELLHRPEVGVVLIEEDLYDALPEDLRRRLARRPLPMVVPFPAPSWGARGETPEAYIVELLRQVIGYRVRLK